MTDEEIIQAAIDIIERRIPNREFVVQSPKQAEDYVVLKLADRESEVFAILFLDNRHRVIEFREMFHGTIDGASVYPREVVKAVIQTNAAAVVLVHNHPSGVAEPSQADERLTRRLVNALELIDVRVLDHLIVGGVGVTSMASRGLV